MEVEGKAVKIENFDAFPEPQNQKFWRLKEITNRKFVIS
jgi:hypothetical protein